MSEPTRMAIRATYEDVVKYQGLLFKLLRELVRENRPLRSEYYDEKGDFHEHEADKFNEYVDRALIGQGTGIKADGEFRRIVDEALPGGVVIENAEDALRFMSLLTSKTFRDDEGNEYGICELWKDVRRLALRVFPLSIKASMAMSPEQWYRRGGVPPDKAE